MNTAESEVQAVASTVVLADYIKALRESLCLPTPIMEIMCDNTSAIVLSTGEGSWRTKSAANKVYAVKEKVDAGKLVVTYVNTKDQCADSLTKFFKGGQDQLRVRTHLSLLGIGKWLSGQGPTLGQEKVFVSRVFFSDSVFLTERKFLFPRGNLSSARL